MSFASRQSVAPGSTTYPTANGVGAPSPETTECHHVPSSSRPEHHIHANAHQSRTPHEWSRCPGQSTAVCLPSTVTSPRTHADCSNRVVAEYGKHDAAPSHVRSRLNDTSRPFSPWNASAGSTSATPVPSLVMRYERNGSIGPHVPRTAPDDTPIGPSIAVGAGTSWLRTSRSG